MTDEQLANFKRRVIALRGRAFEDMKVAAALKDAAGDNYFSGEHSMACSILGILQEYEQEGK